jgi:hypothetical protein
MRKSLCCVVEASGFLPANTGNFVWQEHGHPLQCLHPIGHRATAQMQASLLPRQACLAKFRHESILPFIRDLLHPIIHAQSMPFGIGQWRGEVAMR